MGALHEGVELEKRLAGRVYQELVPLIPYQDSLGGESMRGTAATSQVLWRVVMGARSYPVGHVAFR